MAEDQDKQKPKTTLIKQRKQEPSDHGEKKKVRVVLKRKPASPASSAETPAPAQPERSQPAAEADRAQVASSGPAQPRVEHAAPATTASGASGVQPGAGTQVSAKTAPVEPKGTAPQAETARAEAHKPSASPQGAGAESPKAVPAAEQAAPDAAAKRDFTEQPRVERSRSDRPTADRAPTDRPTTERPRSSDSSRPDDRRTDDRAARPAGRSNEAPAASGETAKSDPTGGDAKLAWTVSGGKVGPTGIRAPGTNRLTRDSDNDRFARRDSRGGGAREGSSDSGETRFRRTGGGYAGRGGQGGDRGFGDRTGGFGVGSAGRGNAGGPPGGDRGRRPDGPPRRPDGAGGPNRGPRPGGSGRPGGPAGPGRPGAPGSRPAPEGGASAAGKKAPGKKFFKSKKTREDFERDIRHEEKQIQLNRKKLQPKANPIPKEIDIMEVITVNELARKMNLKASELIGKLMGMGMMVTINQQIDAETAEILAGEYGCKVRIVSLYDETIIDTGTDSDDDMQSRPPIVTIMGHVDHGKTKLLDAIRSTNVVAGEHGGITQHIGAYQVALPQGKITFLDTPGHEAFTLMRARGAQVTDIVVLVVAANDGVMPQTIEAIHHAKDAGVPIIVAVNKVDLPEANVDRVKQQLSDHQLMPEDWGGNTMFVEVSALKKQGIDSLLETILLQAEVMELKAAYDRSAEGKIIESRIDPGRGTVASVLIERGTLQVGDSFVAGIFAGKVRAMFDDHGRKVEVATPSMPVEIIGFDGVPDSGDPFQVTENEKAARQVGTKRQELKRVEEARNVKKVTLDNLYDSIQQGTVQELKVVIKGDVHGSVEALQNSLERLSTPEVRLNVIHASAGAINESDVTLAAASTAIVVGFHVRPTPRAQALAEREKVEIRKYNIIYDVVDDIRSAMEGLLAPELREEIIGTVDVRDVFKVPKAGIVAGSYVTSGKVQRNAQVRVFRDGLQIFEGKLGSLRRFKDDVREVDSGYECGIGIENCQDLEIGDQLEIFVVKEVAKKLSS